VIVPRVGASGRSPGGCHTWKVNRGAPGGSQRVAPKWGPQGGTPGGFPWVGTPGVSPEGFHREVHRRGFLGGSTSISAGRFSGGFPAGVSSGGPRAWSPGESTGEVPTGSPRVETPGLFAREFLMAVPLVALRGIPRGCPSGWFLRRVPQLVPRDGFQGGLQLGSNMGVSQRGFQVGGHQGASAVFVPRWGFQEAYPGGLLWGPQGVLPEESSPGIPTVGSPVLVKILDPPRGRQLV
jgi:hypothetical protein